MKKPLGKLASLTLIAALSMGALTACGSNSNSGTSTEKETASASTSAPTSVPAEETKAPEPVTITYFADAKSVDDPNTKKLNDDFTAQTGIKIEPVIVAGDDKYQKIDISMTSGDTTDIIGLDNPIVQDKYQSNGWLLPLDDLIASTSYDVNKIYGKYLTKYKDTTYMIPAGASQWAVFYNKKIFDDAKVPYPKGAWTWDQYIETAKKLTDSSKGIYGSYMLDYDNYMYMLARQRNVPGYKPDGTSNYDDPAFKESLKFFGDLGNTLKIQPSWLEFKTKKLAWDGFTTGKYGMHLVGSWYVGVFTDKKNYPLDWKWGITQIPSDSKGGTNNFGVTGGMGINKHSKHPKEAFEYIKFKAENTYKYTGQLPARVDLTTADLQEIYKKISDTTDGDVTVEDIGQALMDNQLGYVEEKLVGPATAEYSKIILEESEKYLVGQTSLDDAIKNIKTKEDKAIEKEKNLAK